MQRRGLDIIAGADYSPNQDFEDDGIDVDDEDEFGDGYFDDDFDAGDDQEGQQDFKVASLGLGRQDMMNQHIGRMGLKQLGLNQESMDGLYDDEEGDDIDDDDVY